MATLYYYGASDSNWQTLGNWWQDEGLTIPATGLPTSSDSVVLSVSDVVNNSGSEPTVVNFTAINCYLSIPLTVTGTASFESSTNSSTLTAASAVFNNNGSNTGTINGNCTFNGTSFNDGTITGACTFTNGSYNLGTITGNCTFEGSSYTNGIIGGDCTFEGGSYNDAAGEITGDCDFSSGSENRYIINGNAIFYGDSFNTGFVFGDADFYGTSYSQGGYVTGSITMYDYSSYTGPGYNMGEPSAATFNDFSSLLGEDVWAFNIGTMNDRSYAGGAEVGNMTFNDNSYGSITAVALSIFGNPILVSSLQGVTSQETGQPAVEISFVRRSGINGSSILGVI